MLFYVRNVFSTMLCYYCPKVGRRRRRRGDELIALVSKEPKINRRRRGRKVLFFDRCVSTVGKVLILFVRGRKVYFKMRRSGRKVLLHFDSKATSSAEKAEKSVLDDHALKTLASTV